VVFIPIAAAGATARSDMAHQAFKDKADDVAEKSKDIKELEQSMLKLKQMFEDLAQLIELQSEQIDAIEVGPSE
jgi:t-SNARE complex subunit (syntaxin)